jgi:FKBP-type peptidyl-prolyl cis-trans isomerase
MRQPIVFLTLILTLTGLYSCNTDPEGYSRTDSGLLYKVIESGKGAQLPEKGDILIMDISYQNHKDSVLFDSRQKKDSFTVVLVEPTFEGGVEEGFAMMHEGDHYLFKAPADSVFLRTFMHKELPPYIEKGSNIKFDVKLHRIIKRAVADSINHARDIEYRRAEFEKIEQYLKKENMDVMPTENGVYIKNIKPGNGGFPVAGDSVTVSFKGMTIDGFVFDETAKDAPFTFMTGTGMVLPGWDEAMPFLQEGSVSRLLIPSDLAYGARGYRDIPGYTSLVFDIEIVRIKKNP